MKIKKIELYNFGSYEDLCSFDLESNDLDRRIVIIGGKNGAGKTTLFTAIKLCLYGIFSFDEKTTKSDYFKRILSLINDRARLRQDDSTYVEVVFSHVADRDLWEYTVHREWTWNGGQLKERLQILQNGIELDQDNSLALQSQLMHMIPPNLLQLYFFDGEHIADHFWGNGKINIRDALMTLSGNDTFEILHECVQRVLKNAKAGDDMLMSQYLAAKAAVAATEERVKAIEAIRESIDAEYRESSNDLQRFRDNYSLQGGLTLEQWNAFTAALKKEESKREQINARRKEIASDILPFLILRNQCEQVLERIQEEEEYITYCALKKTLDDADFQDHFCKVISEAGVTSVQNTQHILDGLRILLLAEQWENYIPCFSLSNDEKRQVSFALERVNLFDLSMLKKEKRALARSLNESKQIRAKLQRGSSERINEYEAEVQAKEQSLRLIEARGVLLSEDLQKAKAQLDNQKQLLAGEKKKFELQLRQKSVTEISSRVLLMLEDLQEEIYARTIKRVERDLKFKLSQLARKQSFFDDIQIDTEFNVHILRKQTIATADLLKILNKRGCRGIRKNIGDVAFSVLLDGADINSVSADWVRALLSDLPSQIELPLEFDKEKMSSGEKQIFVMSLYWALMQQSKNELPFVIDTPFARTDTEHRANIAKHFFMDLTGQLFVLSTNEELTGNNLQIMADQISRMYTLEYGTDQRTYICADQYFEA